MLNDNQVLLGKDGLNILLCSGSSDRVKMLQERMGQEFTIAGDTGNLAENALAADVLVVALDAKRDIPDQIRSQAYIACLLGIPRVVLAIDLSNSDGSQSAFDRLLSQYKALAADLMITAVPISLSGDVAWYDGPTLIDVLENISSEKPSAANAGEQDVADQFAAHLVWMDDDEMLPERGYSIEFASAEATAQITDLVHVVEPGSDDYLAAKTLQKDQIGYCKIALDNAVAFEPAAENRTNGTFRLIDRYTKVVVGVGAIDFALRRASNIEWHEMKIDKAARAAAFDQKPCVLWFTGYSGSGKSSIADRLEQKLHAMGNRTYLLDGDNVRHGLNKDLGFTDQDRVENIRRVAEVSKLMVDAGLIVLTSFISPFRSERKMARELMDDGEFVEVFVNTPLEICEQRDPKGLYKKARAGELKNFTGIDSDYEPPRNAELVLDSGALDADTLADQIIEHLKKMQ